MTPPLTAGGRAVRAAMPCHGEEVRRADLIAAARRLAPDAPDGQLSSAVYTLTWARAAARRNATGPVLVRIRRGVFEVFDPTVEAAHNGTRSADATGVRNSIRFHQ